MALDQLVEKCNNRYVQWNYES